MNPDDDLTPFEELSTPHVADACMRLGIAVRCAPASLTPLLPGAHVVGRVRPAQHSGSVDVFLEALDHAQSGDVLVVDNGGRVDEACVGDLVTLEAAHAGIAAVLIWGLHRDTSELREIGLPLLSLGSSPTGPAAVAPQTGDALEVARVGEHVVSAEDFVLIDDDGAIFLPLTRTAEIVEIASAIRDTEQRQAAAMRSGTSLRELTRFSEYVQLRAATRITFRDHLRSIGGAIEE